jgi:hypothetical protein
MTVRGILLPTLLMTETKASTSGKDMRLPTSQMKKIYGSNGKHLGWFVNGVLFDLRGHRVGSIGEKCPRALYAQPAKFAKLAKYAKYARFAAFAKSALSTGYSNEPLEVFFKGGAVGNI